MKTTIGVWVKITAAWVLFIPLAILNGLVRNVVYQPFVGTLLAHQISTVTICLLFFIAMRFMVGSVLQKMSNMRALTVGVYWLMLTALFEFGFGHYIMGNSWEKLLADYHIEQGRIWVIVLIMIALTPLLIKRFSRFSVRSHGR